MGDARKEVLRFNIDTQDLGNWSGSDGQSQRQSYTEVTIDDNLIDDLSTM